MNKFEDFSCKAQKLIAENWRSALAWIGKALLAGAAAIIVKPAVDYSSKIDDTLIHGTDFSLPFGANAQERAIRAIAVSAHESDWSSEKKKAAKDIYDIVDNNPEDSTKDTAIRALNWIASSTSWSSDKMYINNIIKEIAMM